MKKLLFVLTSICVLTSCKTENTETDLHRVVFDSGDLEFISSSVNPKNETSSILYGNKEAILSLSNQNVQPIKGSKFKLVTWKYHENPQYIGGTITGEFVSIETLTTDKTGNVFYQFTDDSKSDNNPPDKEERVRYFMSYLPVERP
ncbi:hypothetical protein [Sinomicrobium sp.]